MGSEHILDDLIVFVRILKLVHEKASTGWTVFLVSPIMEWCLCYVFSILHVSWGNNLSLNLLTEKRSKSVREREIQRYEMGIGVLEISIDRDE